MQDWSRVIELRGGLIATHELLARGESKASIRAALRREVIRRVRKGWYCASSLPELHVRAARVGGRLTCESAAARLGVWLPTTDGRLHVAVEPDRTQLRRSDEHTVRRRSEPEPEVEIHWADDRTAGSRVEVPIDQMLVDLSRCHDPEYVLVAAKSALHARLIDSDGLARALDRMPARHRAVVGRARPESESGGETLFVSRMRALGILCRQQVWIGRDRVDALIGECLVVEIDGRAFHDRARDNRRDARLIRRGYRVLHFDSDQILNEWPAVLATVITAISRGDHLRS